MKLKPNILILEDNPGDTRLIREILNENNISTNLYVAKDEETAVKMLYKKGNYSNLSRPDLILLDISLTKKDGKNVLRDIKLDNKFDDIPIIILTECLPDIKNIYNKLVDTALLKPSDLDGFNEVKKSIQNVLNKKIKS
jgi:CheY-like chemotaxis protein